MVREPMSENFGLTFCLVWEKLATYYEFRNKPLYA